MLTKQVEPRFKVGTLILKELSEQYDNNVPYSDFKAAVKQRIANDILLQNFLGESIVSVIRNFKQFSVDLVAEGVVSFQVDGDILKLTNEGYDLATDFWVKYKSSKDAYEQYQKAEAENILHNMDVKVSSVVPTNFNNKNGYIPVIKTQEAILCQHVDGRRCVIVFGLGLFELNNLNDYRPKFQTIVE